MDDLAISDIHCHMVHSAVAARIENQIARLHIGRGNFFAHLGLRAGVMRQRYAEFLHDFHGKAGTVRPLCEAGSAPDIGVAHKLQGIIYHLGTSGSGAGAS